MKIIVVNNTESEIEKIHKQLGPITFGNFSKIWRDKIFTYHFCAHGSETIGIFHLEEKSCKTVTRGIIRPISSRHYKNYLQNNKYSYVAILVVLIVINILGLSIIIWRYLSTIIWKVFCVYSLFTLFEFCFYIYLGPTSFTELLNLIL